MPRYQLLFPDETENTFLFLLSLSVSISEAELHIQLLRCWPRVPLLQLPAALLCVQQQSLSESQTSPAGVSLPATGPNSQSKMVKNAVLPFSLHQLFQLGVFYPHVISIFTL